jgi:hypothetical protein
LDCRFTANSDFEDFTVETAELNLGTPGHDTNDGNGHALNSSFGFNDFP